MVKFEKAITRCSVSLMLIQDMSTSTGSFNALDNAICCHTNVAILTIVSPSIIQKIEMACLALAVLSFNRFMKMWRNKKWQAPHIAPLQPSILAAFRPWGGSTGAGRVRPAAAKIRG